MDNPIATTNYLDRLTSREKQVLHYIARGYSNAQIAEVLEISVNTVRIYVRGILRKLEVPKRSMAASQYWINNQQSPAVIAG